MPTYSYHCNTCGHDFEAVQRFVEDALTECPECGSPIRRVIQPVGVVFKGSGWYINDSRPKGSGDRPERSSSEAESTASSDKSDKSAKTDKADKAEKATSSTTAGKSDSAAKADKTPAKVAD